MFFGKISSYPIRIQAGRLPVVHAGAEGDAAGHLLARPAGPSSGALQLQPGTQAAQACGVALALLAVPAALGRERARALAEALAQAVNATPHLQNASRTRFELGAGRCAALCALGATVRRKDDHCYTPGTGKPRSATVRRDSPRDAGEPGDACRSRSGLLPLRSRNNFF